MKRIFIAPLLFFMISSQGISVKALEPTIGTSQLQVAHFATAPKGVNDDVRDAVLDLNKKINTKEYENIKNTVYNELSDYMKIKYKLYEIHFVEDIRDIPTYKDEPKRVLGLIRADLNFIIIENNNDHGHKTVESTLLHELGHALDTYDETDNKMCKQMFKYSNTTEFKEIFYDEKYDLQGLSDEYYFTDKIEEYFAESYAIYIENPDKMKKEAPRTFSFIDKVANQKYVDIPSTDWIINNMKNSYLYPILKSINNNINKN